MARVRRSGKDLEASALEFLASTETPEASDRLREHGLGRVMAKARAERGEKALAAERRAFRSPALLRHVVVAAVVVLVVMLVSTSGAYAASYRAQPDSPLYGTKIFFERVRVVLTSSQEQDVRLEMGFSERRMEELQNMVSSGNRKGAERWLREYSRNIEGAGVLFDTLPEQETAELSGQFQEMLDRQAHMMQGLDQGGPSGLSEPIEEAYRVCDQERMRMRRRCGQEEGNGPQDEGGQQQRQGECPGGGGPSQQQDQPSSTEATTNSGNAGTGGTGDAAGTGFPAGSSPGTTLDAPMNTISDPLSGTGLGTSQSPGSQVVDSGQVTMGEENGGGGTRMGYIPR